MKKPLSYLADALALTVFIAMSAYAVLPPAASLKEEYPSTVSEVVENLRRDERRLETLLGELEKDQETLRRLMEQPKGVER